MFASKSCLICQNSHLYFFSLSDWRRLLCFVFGIWQWRWGGRQYGIVGLIGENWDFCPVNFPRENRLDLLSLDLSLFEFFLFLTIYPYFSAYHSAWLYTKFGQNQFFTLPHLKRQGLQSKQQNYFISIWSKNQRLCLAARSFIRGQQAEVRWGINY